MQWQHRDFAPISSGILGPRICGVALGYSVDWQPGCGSHLVPQKGGKGTLKGSVQPVFLPLLSQIFSVDVMKFSTGKCLCKARCWNGLVPATVSQSLLQLQGSRDSVLYKPLLKLGMVCEKLILVCDV